MVFRLKLSVQVSKLFSVCLHKKKKNLRVKVLWNFGFLGKKLYESMAFEKTWHTRNSLSFPHGFQPLTQKAGRYLVCDQRTLTGYHMVSSFSLFCIV